MFKLFGRSKKDDIDPSFGYARLEEFQSYLQHADYTSFEKEYETLAWDAQTLLNEGIGLHVESATALQDWVEQSPDSYVANLFAGVSKTVQAWKARTAAAGSQVSEKNAERFFELLEEAAEYLQHADELNPDHPETGARIIRVYMGLGVEPEPTKTFFDAAVAVVPDHLMTHLMMINYLSPKWRGSAADMHQFAEERLAASGNSLLISLKLFAVVEEWVYYGMMDETKQYKQYFKNEQLKEQLVELYDHYREQPSGALLIPYVYNYFAFLFWQFGLKEKAREILKKIGGTMTTYPWAYLGIESNEKLQKL